MASCRTASETTRLILDEPPDLIIAHTHPMLGVACLAAHRLDCRWGFDCEDPPSEEYGEGLSDPAHQALVRYVEATFMSLARRCHRRFSRIQRVAGRALRNS